MHSFWICLITKVQLHTWIAFGEQVVAKGMAFSEHAYLRSGWNIIDGTLVFISLVDLVISLTASTSPRIFGILRVFRLLRALKPLRYDHRHYFRPTQHSTVQLVSTQSVVWCTPVKKLCIIVQKATFPFSDHVIPEVKVATSQRSPLTALRLTGTVLISVSDT